MSHTHGQNGDLKDRIWIQMNQFNFVVMQEAANKLVGWETKPALEEGGENNNFIGISHGNTFILIRPPLKNDTGRENVVVDEFEKLTLIDGRKIEHFWMRGGMVVERGFGLEENPEAEGERKKKTVAATSASV
jgi:hypothetical protein